MKQIAIIGAGLAGLILGRQLQISAEVTVFEKSRGPGGRMATRREAGFAFDHGAQYFTVRSEPFQAFLPPLLEQGIVRPWQPHVLTFAQDKKPYKRDWFEPHYVASPGMSSLCRTLTAGLHVEYGMQVASLIPTGQGWQLQFESGELAGPFDWVLSSMPCPQMQNMLGEHLTGLPQETRESLQAVRMAPCYTLMLGFDVQHNFGFDAAKIMDPVLDWVSINSSKPGRNPNQTMVVHSTAAWASEKIDCDAKSVESAMLSALAAVLPAGLPEPCHTSLHRWRHASVAQALEIDSVMDHEQQFGFCGDWCIGNRVEAAWISAMHLARQVTPLLGE